MSNWLSLRSLSRRWREVGWLRPLILAVVIGFVILLTFGVTQWRVDQKAQQLRQNLLNQTVAIASTINLRQLEQLSFTVEDTKRPYFQRLHRQMRAYGQTFGHRRIFTVVQRDGKLIFGPHSLPPHDQLAVPPGTVYQNPPARVASLFTDPRTLVLGPYQDEFGSFVTAYAPVFQPRHGQVILLVAIDIEASQWYRELRAQILSPVLFGLLLIGLVIGTDYLLYHRPHWLDNKYLKHLETFAITVFGVVLTIGATVLVSQVEIQHRQAAFHEIAVSRARVFAERLLDIQTYGLSALSEFMVTDSNVSRSQYRRFTLPLTQESSIQAWNLIPRVTNGQRAEFEAQVRAEGFDDFEIFQRDYNGQPTRATGAGPFFPILYTEPFPENQRALGFDIASNPLIKPTLA